MSSSSDSIQPVISVRNPPPESRSPLPDYKEEFDQEVAVATAESLRGYLVGLSGADGCVVSVRGEGRNIECDSPDGSSLSIEVFGDDVFDMTYSPTTEQALSHENRAVLLLLMPGYDSDHVAAYARHYLQGGQISV